MPTELEELVGFIGHGNPQIRHVAIEHLVPYSTSQPSLFKAEEFKPIKNLKVLIRDHPKAAVHVITILVNLAADEEILESLVTDDRFLESVFAKIVNPSEPNANLLSMLLANLAKSDSIKTILDRKQPAPEELRSDDRVLNQLVDLFVRGADGTYNKDANFDYLAYLFADLAKHAELRQHFVTPQTYDDGAIPLTKLKVFTEHKSDVRRKGVASTLKNVAFDLPSHPSLLSDSQIHVLPYVLLPIMGSEDYDEDDMMDMLPELQLLPPDKRRDPDHTVVQTHVETLTLLASTREGRKLMRELKVYPIIRETHLRVDDEGVREACERLVNLLMGEEETAVDDERVAQTDEDDDEDRVVQVI